MARLAADSAPRSISARQHFAAIAYLRWRLFVNGLGRRGGTGELIARNLGYALFGIFILSVLAGAGGAAYAAASRGDLGLLAGLFWAIFLLQLVVSINIAAPGLNFDPESLIRFPLSFSRYLTIRLFLGLLSASTIVGTLALLAAATGVTLATPALAPIVFAAALALALTNMLFTRMIFAWVDRWLSTRRAREVFTALIFVFFLGIQYLNIMFNGGGRDGSDAQQHAQYVKIAAFLHFYGAFKPFLLFLPPGLAGSSVANAVPGSVLFALVDLAGVLVYATLFLAIFAWRIEREYRGENLSEAGSRDHARAPTSLRSHSAPASHDLVSSPALTLSQSRRSILSPVILACLRKEFLYIRRNTTQYYSLLAPLAMVFIFAGRTGPFARTEYTFPMAMVYSFMGIAALSYNSLGLDASGVQFYFLAPVPMRTVMLAKNIFSFLISALQVLILYVLLRLTLRAPSLLITLSTLCWVLFAALVNVTLGNMRSITAPKKIDPAKLARRQASQLSALISVGVILAMGALGYGILLLARAEAMPWLPIPILLALALAALTLYLAGLKRIDTLALNHRESIIEELAKN